MVKKGKDFVFLVAGCLIGLFSILGVVSGIYVSSDDVTISADSEDAVCDGRGLCVFDFFVTNDDFEQEKSVSIVPFFKEDMEKVSVESLVDVNQDKEVGLVEVVNPDVFEFNEGFVDGVKDVQVERSSVEVIGKGEQKPYRYVFNVPLLYSGKFDINVQGKNVTILDPFVNNYYFTEPFDDSSFVNSSLTTAIVSGGTASLLVAGGVLDSFENNVTADSIVDTYNVSASGVSKYYGESGGNLYAGFNLNGTQTGSAYITLRINKTGMYNITQGYKYRMFISQENNVSYNWSANIFNIGLVGWSDITPVYAIWTQWDYSFLNTTNYIDFQYNASGTCVNVWKNDVKMTCGSVSSISGYQSGFGIGFKISYTNLDGTLTGDYLGRIYNFSYYSYNKSSASITSIDLKPAKDIASFKPLITASGTCSYEYSVDGSNWNTLVNNTNYDFSSRTRSFLWRGTLGSACVLDALNFTFEDNHVPKIGREHYLLVNSTSDFNSGVYNGTIVRNGSLSLDLSGVVVNTSGLVFAWTNNVSCFVDDTGKSVIWTPNNVFRHNSTGGVFGLGACEFNRTSNQMLIVGNMSASHPLRIVEGVVSNAFWIKFAEINRGNSPFSWGDLGLCKAAIGWYLENPGVMTWGANNNTGGDCNGASTMGYPTVHDIGRWYHMAVVSNGTHGDLYLDGAFVKTTAYAKLPIANVTGNFTLGWAYSTFIMNGSVDDVYVWNRTVTASEIASLYRFGKITHQNYTSGVFDVGSIPNVSSDTIGVLVNWSSPNSHTNLSYRVRGSVDNSSWSSWGLRLSAELSNDSVFLMFNTPHGSNNVTNDSSGLGYNATVYGASHRSSGGLGDSGYYFFDGVNDYLEINESFMNVGTNDFSFSFWLNSSSVGATQRIVNKRLTATNVGYEVVFETNGKIYLYISDVTGNFYQPLTVNAPTTGFHHYVVTVDRDASAVCYVDGLAVLSHSGVQLRNQSLSNAQPVKFGQYNTGGVSPLNGSLDDFRMWNYSLSSQQVYNLYLDSYYQSPELMLPYSEVVRYYEVQVLLNANVTNATTFSSSQTLVDYIRLYYNVSGSVPDSSGTSNCFDVNYSQYFSDLDNDDLNFSVNTNGCVLITPTVNNSIDSFRFCALVPSSSASCNFSITATDGQFNVTSYNFSVNYVINLSGISFGGGGSSGQHVVGAVVIEDAWVTECDLDALCYKALSTLTWSSIVNFWDCLVQKLVTFFTFQDADLKPSDARSVSSGDVSADFKVFMETGQAGDLWVVIKDIFMYIFYSNPASIAPIE